jgi:hypothetical protein
MGGMGAGSGTGAGERPASDASGLLEGSREPWAVTPGQHGADTGSSPGAQPGAGHLWLAGQNDGAGTGRTDGMGGEGISGSPSAVSPAGAPFGTAGAQDTGSSGGKASSGLLDGLPFLAAGTWAAAASGRSEEGTQGRRAESGAGHPGAAWTSADNAGLAAPAAAGAGAAPVAGTAPQEPAGASKAAGQVASEAVGSTDVATQAVSAAAPGTPQAQAPNTPEPTPEPGQDAAGQASGTAVHAAEGTVQEAVGMVTPMRPVVVPVAAPVPGPVQESAARVSAQTPVNGSARRPARASASEALTAGATSTAPGISTTDATSATDAAARWVVPVTVSGGPAADDMSAWDAPDSSLRHLLGGPAAGAAAADGTVAATTDQEAAAVIGVAGAAYAVGRLTGANEAQTFEEPVRPAWKPKAPGSGAPRRMEFTCATGPGDPPAAKKSDESEAPGTQSKGRTRRKDKEDDESTSVGDLLRQSEEIWGAGTRRTGSRG